MTKGEQMLRKLEGYKTPEQFAEELSDSYSSSGYRNGFVNCIRMLRKRGYLDNDIEEILRSKVTRWARDMSNNKYGMNSANDLARYMDQYPDSIRDMVEYDPTKGL